jgi:hypothetical protein
MAIAQKGIAASQGIYSQYEEVMKENYERTNKTATQVRLGKILFDRLFQRDKNYGGIFAEITGLPGTGKTGVMIDIAKRILKMNEINGTDEKVYWRESLGSPMQFLRVGNKYKIFIEDGAKIKFIDMNNNNEVRLRYETFATLNELEKIADPNKINVVFFKNEEMPDISPTSTSWIRFIDFLRSSGGWKTVLIDEYEDIAPNDGKGRQWYINSIFTEIMKQVRKGCTSVVCNTQSTGDVCWQARTKIMMNIFMGGSHVPRHFPFEVYKKVYKLPPCTAYICLQKALYGIIKFNPISPADDIKAVDTGCMDKIENILNSREQKAKRLKDTAITYLDKIKDSPENLQRRYLDETDFEAIEERFES